MRAFAISALIGAVALTGCTTDPTTGQRDYNKTAIGSVIGAAAGYGLSKSNANSSSQNNRGALIGAVVGGAGGYILDQREKKLKEQLAGSGVSVDRNEDGSIGLVMPGNITFATNDATINPQFYATLNKVAQQLNDGKVAVVVSGYTDSTGNDSINIPLSQRRAQSVQNYLIQQGVPSNRINAQGYGASNPIASNATADGKQQNRRVELSIYAVS
ncbi:OmpA family lipoprotein [Acinetobacter puyangensis]|uniref:Outer membrane protein OmpA n=1 Tax=Acinetobacter puyangensis TaxID=1096779 RepID=A0A240EDH2_9GAMM|nr:OmpA family protein [Acinetobacter puyangensis]SNX46606.1 Outer membrane protein OmpA [Acinetobacter puyangensis]